MADVLERAVEAVEGVGLGHAKVYWAEPEGMDCEGLRVGFVALGSGHAMTVHLEFVGGKPKVKGFDTGWPV